MIKTSILLSILFTSAIALAETSGSTADGCTYRIINGKYLTDCSNKKEKGEDKLIAQSSAPATSMAVTSYDSVPMRESNDAPKSNFGSTNGGTSTLSIPVSAPVQSAIVVDREERDAKPVGNIAKVEAIKSYVFNEKTYLGLNLGSSSISQSNAGSSLGLGLELGTNIDDSLGIVVGYSYTKQNQYLGRAENNPKFNGSNYDAALSANLFYTELQWHITEARSKIRPFLGAGLGLKSSTLQEKNLSPTGYNQLNSYSSAGSLSQQSFGASLSAGSKFFISRSFDLIGSFRYYAPFLRQKARIQVPYTSAGPTATYLTQEDNALTGSSQYQFSVGMLFVF